MPEGAARERADKGPGMPEGADPDPGRAAARRHPGPGAGLRCPHGRNRLRHLRPSRHPQSAPAVSSDEALSVITTLGPSYSPVGALLVVVPVVPDLVVIASVFHLSRVLGRDARGSANAPSIPQGSPRLAQEAGRNEQGAGAQQGRGLRHRLGGRRPWDLRSGLRQPPVDRLVGAFRAGIRSTRPGRATTAPRPGLDRSWRRDARCVDASRRGSGCTKAVPRCRGRWKGSWPPEGRVGETCGWGSAQSGPGAAPRLAPPDRRSSPRGALGPGRVGSRSPPAPERSAGRRLAAVASPGGETREECQ